MIHETAFIHPKAHVEGATIGARTKVWQFASVIRGAILGEDCTVASCATVDGSIYGDRVIISQGYAAGPGFKVGNDVFIGPNVTLCNDRWPRFDKEGFDIELYRTGMFAIVIEDGAAIGANAVVLPGVRIGKGAMVAAGAVCRKNLEAGYVLKKNGSYEPVGPRERMQFCIST